MATMSKVSSRRVAIIALGVALGLGLALGVAVQSRAQSVPGVQTPPRGTSGSEIGAASIIVGQVQLQGRSDWSGAVVTVLPVGMTDTTGSDGFYTLPALPIGTYTITVEMARYLDAERVITLIWGANDIPSVRLLAGDANDDDVVDIVDVSIIGGKYDSTVNPLTERADVNADGYVDIVDIVLAAGNYAGASPVNWP